MSFQVGDVVEVVRVIETDNAVQNEKKKKLIGLSVVISKNESHPDEIYYAANYCSYPFSAVELRKVEEIKTIPSIGDTVLVVGSAEFRTVKNVKVYVTYENGNGSDVTLQMARKATATERVAHLTAQRNALQANAVDAMEKTIKLNEQIVLLAQAAKEEERVANEAAKELAKKENEKAAAAPAVTCAVSNAN
jgi:C-terminal processing protease CtpA/Prc